MALLFGAALARPGQSLSAEAASSPKVAQGCPIRRYRLAGSSIRAIAPNLGAGLATNRITVDGAAVGYMYREDPDDRFNSGWRFFAGDESDDYLAEPCNIALYDVNTIANYDPQIVPYLGGQVGAAFRRENGQFKPDHIDRR